MNPWFITVNDEGKLELSNDAHGIKPFVVESMEDIRFAVADSELYCSSALDFPGEFTSDPAVIAMCDIIRR